MIPVLYGPDEKDFRTNGFGPLSDAVSVLVSEDRNGQYELGMTYPVTGNHYDELRNERIILAVPGDGARAQPFEIYDISEPIDGNVKVSAQHISYRLKELTVMPFNKVDTPSAAMQKIQESIAGTHPFTFETNKTTAGSMELKIPTACRSLLGGMEGSVLDSFGGGEYEFDRFSVKLWEARGHDRGVVIQYGKNLTESTKECSIIGAYTSVVPFWIGTDENEQEIYVIGDKVESDHVGDYSCQKCVPLDLSSYWETQPTKEQVEERAAKYLKDNTPWKPDVSVEASFVPLNQVLEYEDIKSVEHVQLCDIVTIEGRDYSVQAKVIGTVYNVLRDCYDSIEVGEARTSFAQEVTKNTVTEGKMDSKVKSAVQKASERLSKLISEASGMYCTEQVQPDGSTIYLLHDKKTMTESRNVIKLTSEAIGFSTDGGQTYPYGFTITGEMIARLLSADGVNANWINTGILQSHPDENGERAFFLDLVNGILEMNAASIRIAGKAVATSEEVDMAIEASAGKIRTEISETYSTKGEAADGAAAAQGAAEGYTDDKLKNYSTTTEMQSAIEQTAESITSTVSKTLTETYATKAYADDKASDAQEAAAADATAKADAAQGAAEGYTDDKLKNYSTTTEMQSAIKQRADAIELEVGKKVGADEIISRINQSAEQIKIQASKIVFEGLVTANQNFQIKTDGSIVANNAEISGNITIAGNWGGIKQGEGMTIYADGTTETTSGIMMYGSNGPERAPFIMVTNRGARLQGGDDTQLFVSNGRIGFNNWLIADNNVSIGWITSAGGTQAYGFLRFTSADQFVVGHSNYPTYIYGSNIYFSGNVSGVVKSTLLWEGSINTNTTVSWSNQGTFLFYIVQGRPGASSSSFVCATIPGTMVFSGTDNHWQIADDANFTSFILTPTSLQRVGGSGYLYRVFGIR